MKSALSYARRGVMGIGKAGRQGRVTASEDRRLESCTSPPCECDFCLERLGRGLYYVAASVDATEYSALVRERVRYSRLACISPRRKRVQYRRESTERERQSDPLSQVRTPRAEAQLSDGCRGGE